MGDLDFSETVEMSDLKIAQYFYLTKGIGFKQDLIIFSTILSKKLG